MGDPIPPPQVSPDGKFYWDGQRWVPMQQTPPQSAPQGASPGPQPLLQPNVPGYAQSTGSIAYPAHVVIAGTRTNGFAVASLIAGIATWVLCPVIAAIVAVICGHAARSQMKLSGEGGSGMAVAGLILGYIQIAIVGVFAVFWVLVLVIGGIAVGVTPHARVVSGSRLVSAVLPAAARAGSKRVQPRCTA